MTLHPNHTHGYLSMLPFMTRSQYPAAQTTSRGVHVAIGYMAPWLPPALVMWSELSREDADRVDRLIQTARVSGEDADGTLDGPQVEWIGYAALLASCETDEERQEIDAGAYYDIAKPWLSVFPRQIEAVAERMADGHGLIVAVEDAFEAWLEDISDELHRLTEEQELEEQRRELDD